MNKKHETKICSICYEIGQRVVAGTAGNSSKLFKLIRDTEGHRNTVNETIYEIGGTLTVNMKRYLDR